MWNLRICSLLNEQTVKFTKIANYIYIYILNFKTWIIQVLDILCKSKTILQTESSKS